MRLHHCCKTGYILPDICMLHLSRMQPIIRPRCYSH